MEKLKTKVRPFLTVLQGQFNGDDKDVIMKCFEGKRKISERQTKAGNLDLSLSLSLLLTPSGKTII